MITTILEHKVKQLPLAFGQVGSADLDFLWHKNRGRHLMVLLFFIPMLALGSSGFDDEALFYSVGPGGGGAIIYATINPQDGNNITLSCDMSSTFISTDGGEHFKSYRFWDYTRYDYNPHDANIIYAYHRQQVYISHDKGVTFDYFAPDIDVIEKVGHNMQLSNAQNGTSKVIYKRQNGQMAHLVTTSPSNIDAYRIKKVYVHPTDPQTIYIFFDGGATNLPMGIARSTDGGETWHDFARGFADNLYRLGNARYGNTVLSTIQPDGTYLPIGDNDNNNYGDYVDMVIIDDKLVAMGNEGLYVFDRDGEVIEQYPVKNRFGQFAVSGNGLTVYITSENGFEIQKSVDFGATWTKVVGGNTLAEESDFYERLMLQNGAPANNVRHQHYFRALQVAGNSIYVSFNSDRGNTASWDRNYLDWVQNVNTAGVAVSHDAGETWLWSFESTYFMRKDYITSGSVAEMNNAIRTTFAIAVNKGNPNQAIITNHYSAFQTLDGGLTWKSLESNTVKEEDGRTFYTTRGVEPAGQHAFAVDPSNANHQYSGWTDIGLWETFDGGKSWAKVTLSADFRSTNAWGVTFNPNNPDIILASNVNSNKYKGDGGEYLPETVLDVIYGEPSVASIRGRIMRSADGGKTWAEATINDVGGFPDTYLKILPTAIVFDPVNESTAYFSSNGIGVFRSTDSGATWSIMNDGLEMQESAGRYGIGAHELTLGTDQKTLFVHTGRTASADFKRFGDTYYLDLTTNSTTWTKLNRPNDTKSNYYDEGTWIFSIDRAPDGVLYAGTSVRKQVNDAGTDKYLIDGECGGAYVSTDMGVTWRQIYNEIQSVYAVKIDARNPDNLYISAMGNILMSTKGENTTLDDWIEIATIPHRLPWKIYEDPNNKNRIMASTNCGGTWSMAFAEPVVYYSVNIGTFIGGTVNADKMSALPDETVTLTITPDVGYVLSSITASSVTLYGTGATRTFMMPTHDVTITATFQDMTYQYAWDAALPLIENEIFILTQEEAPNESATRYRLAELINALIASTGFTITPDDIDIIHFVPALTGDADNPAGNNGLFEFLVIPSDVTPSAYNSGTITATLFNDVANEQLTMKNEQLKALSQNGTLYVSGLTKGKSWYINNIYGQTIYTGIAVDEKAEVPSPTKGIYIITDENKSIKVVIP